MENATPAPEQFGALDDLIETHIQTLVGLLARPHTLEELKAELAEFNSLLYSLSCRNELIQKLLDGATPDEKRRRIQDALKATRLQSAYDQEELTRLRERSNGLIKRGMSLVAQAQTEIDKQAHRHAGYALETCGLCKGLRRSAEGFCVACKGEGTVLVRLPAE